MSGEDQYSAASDQYAQGYCQFAVEWVLGKGGLSVVGLGDEISLCVWSGELGTEDGFEEEGEGNGMGGEIAEGGERVDADQGYAGAGCKDFSPNVAEEAAGEMTNA